MSSWTGSYLKGHGCSSAGRNPIRSDSRGNRRLASIPRQQGCRYRLSFFGTFVIACVCVVCGEQSTFPIRQDRSSQSHSSVFGMPVVLMNWEWDPSERRSTPLGLCFGFSSRGVLRLVGWGVLLRDIRYSLCVLCVDIRRAIPDGSILFSADFSSR